MYSHKKNFIILCLILIWSVSCSHANEENISSPGESLFYDALEADMDSQLLWETAELLAPPWSGEALILLTRQSAAAYYKPSDETIPPEKLYRQWKKYTREYGEKEESLESRQLISLINGHDPREWDDSESSAGESLYAYLHALEKKKAGDQATLIEYLDSPRDSDELDFLMAYLGKADLLGALPSHLISWIQLKQAVLGREYSAAYSALSRLDRIPDVTGRAGFYRDSRWVLASHPDRWDILRRWEERADHLDDDARGSLWYYDGLVRRSLGSYRSSSERFSRAMDGDYYDKALWYYLDTRDSAGFSLSDDLTEYCDSWHSPSYFDDLVDRTVTDLVSRSRWDDLLDLEDALAENGSSYSRDRLAWINARAGEAGYNRLSSDEIGARYKAASDRQNGNWYTFCASMAWKGQPDYLDSLPESSRAVTRESPGQDDGEDMTTGAFLGPEAVFLGLLAHDIPLAAREWYDEFREEFSPGALREYSYYLRRRADYLESIRIAGYMNRRADYVKTLEDYRLLYPLEYSGPIERWCRENGISEQLFRALVKTESGYDRHIISYAGAIGLSQLMPATAEERMELMGMGQADLTDPDVNIAVGTSYMRWLYDRAYIDNHVKAAAAYNGGPGSVRKWNRAMGHLPPELYMEGIPYIQTREYVRSLFKGAMVYASLYTDISPSDTLAELLPGTFGPPYMNQDKNQDKESP